MKKIIMIACILAGVSMASAGCVSDAIKDRDATILEAFATHSTTVQTALSTRSTALQTAWNLEDKTARKNAVKEAWKGYKSTVMQSKFDLLLTRKKAWIEYGNALKACKEVDTINSTQDIL